MNAFAEARRITAPAKKSSSQPTTSTLSLMPPRTVAGFEIAGDPLPEKRQVVGKYDKLFSALRPGQAIRCESKQVNLLAGALRSYMTRNGIEGGIKVCANYLADTTGKKGRVWLLPKEAA